MTIAEARTSCKAAFGRARAYIEGLPRDVVAVTILLLACSASFALGVQVGQGMSGHSAGTSAPEAIVPAVAPARGAEAGQIVASKNGTKYYTPGCSGAGRISASNIVTFASASAAEAAGYTLASGCRSK